jgi:hypothetical protein
MGLNERLDLSGEVDKEMLGREIEGRLLRGVLGWAFMRDIGG